MKIVINRCFGGYGLSALATSKLAEIKRKDCYFFTLNQSKYIPVTLEEAENSFMCRAFTVPNPNDYSLDVPDENGLYIEANKRANEIALDDFSYNRSDEDLVSVVEELGEKANTRYSKLVVVEIPDGTDYVIEEYDGLEHIAEKHRTWN